VIGKSSGPILFITWLGSLQDNLNGLVAISSHLQFRYPAVQLGCGNLNISGCHLVSRMIVSEKNVVHEKKQPSMNIMCRKLQQFL
jgi:hypothetical protein